MKRRFIEEGRVFGRWTVVRQQTGGRSMCKCSCGTERSINEKDLLKGTSTSCGCFRRECLRARATGTVQERNIWNGMMKRCYNKKSSIFKNYGGRGITVCRRWHKFENFLTDMGKRPDNLHSIERKNNDRLYSPSNCVWATRDRQARNKRNNINITFRGKTKILKDWCRELGISYPTAYGRFRRGRPLSEVLSPAET